MLSPLFLASRLGNHWSETSTLKSSCSCLVLIGRWCVSTAGLLCWRTHLCMSVMSWSIGPILWKIEPKLLGCCPLSLCIRQCRFLPSNGLEGSGAFCIHPLPLKGLVLPSTIASQVGLFQKKGEPGNQWQQVLLSVPTCPLLLHTAWSLLAPSSQHWGLLKAPGAWELTSPRDTVL